MGAQDAILGNIGGVDIKGAACGQGELLQPGAGDGYGTI